MFSNQQAQGAPAPHGSRGRLSPLSRLLTTVGVIALVPILAACATTASGAGTGDAKDGGILKIGSPAPNAAPEPVTMHDPGAINVVQQVAEYLLWSENDGELSPRLATSWVGSEDAASWTITLRDDVTFSDGSPLTSADVVASIETLIAPDSVSAAASAFAGILSSGSITAPDDLTVVFELDRPFADFPYLVSSANYNTVILKADYDGDFLGDPIGTGPFLLEDYSASTGATFVPNEDYWDAEAVHFDEVDMSFFTDYSAMTAALLSSTIDVASTVSYAANQALYSTDAVVLKTTNIAGGTFFALRTDTAPWDDKLVRQALALSLNREELLQALQGGQGEIANDNIFASIYAQKVDVPQREQDIDKAKDLLAQAGYPDGLEATLSAPQSLAPYAQLIQQMAAKAGFELTLEIQDEATFYGSTWLEAPLGLTGWAARPTASQFLSLAFTSDAAWNTAHWSNPEFDALVSDLQSTVDETEREAIAQEIATLMTEEVPQIITTWPQTGIAMLPHVKGIPVNAAQYADIYRGWLEH